MNRIALAIALALAASTAAAQAYRWVDQDGKVHYTDTPPPATAKNVQKKPAASGAAETGPGYATQQAVKNFPVVLYTFDGCVPCKEARALLAKRGVPFREVTVGDDASREELQKVSGGLELPVLAVGRDIKKGYEAGMYNAALDAAGYPTSAPPIAQNAAKAEGKAGVTPPEPPKGRYSPL